jgi:hypothetical protein
MILPISVSFVLMFLFYPFHLTMLVPKAFY